MGGVLADVNAGNTSIAAVATVGGVEDTVGGASVTVGVPVTVGVEDAVGGVSVTVGVEDTVEGVSVAVEVKDAVEGVSVAVEVEDAVEGVSVTVGVEDTGGEALVAVGEVGDIVGGTLVVGGIKEFLLLLVSKQFSEERGTLEAVIGITSSSTVSFMVAEGKIVASDSGVTENSSLKRQSYNILLTPPTQIIY